MIDLAKIIRIGRAKKGINQTALAKLIGAGNASVSEWESARSSPSSEMLIKLLIELDLVGEVFPGWIKNDHPSSDLVGVSGNLYKLKFMLPYEKDKTPLETLADFINCKNYQAEDKKGFKIIEHENKKYLVDKRRHYIYIFVYEDKKSSVKEPKRSKTDKTASEKVHLSKDIEKSDPVYFPNISNPNHFCFKMIDGNMFFSTTIDGKEYIKEMTPIEKIDTGLEKKNKEIIKLDKKNKHEENPFDKARRDYKKRENKNHTNTNDTGITN